MARLSEGFRTSIPWALQFLISFRKCQAITATANGMNTVRAAQKSFHVKRQKHVLGKEFEPSEAELTASGGRASHSLPFHALSASWWISRVGPVAPHFRQAP